MIATDVECDVRFTQRLRDRDCTALSAFQSRFADVLSAAWRSLTAAVTDCRDSLNTVASHVGYAAGRGYLKNAGHDASAAFTAYVTGLKLCDLELVGACLNSDDACLTHISDLIERRTLPVLLSLWKDGQLPGVSRSTVEEAGRGLTGHLWSTPQKGVEQRIATYDGQCRLTSWLILITHNLIRDESRKQRRIRSTDSRTDNMGGNLDHMPSTSDSSSVEREDLVQHYRRQFLAAVTSVEKRLNARQRIVFQGLYFERLQAAEIAGILGVSRARVSQITAQIRTLVFAEARGLAEQLAVEIDVPQDVVLQALSNLDAFLNAVD